MASATVNDPSELADPNTAKIPKQAMGLMLAHRAIMEEDLRATLADTRNKARAWWQNKGAAGIQGEGSVSVPAEPDMGDIHIGDINYATPAPTGSAAPSVATSPATAGSTPAPAAPPASIAAPAPIASGLSKLAKAAVIASAALGGGGIGAVATSLLSQPSNVSVSVPAPQVNVPNNEPLLQFFKPSSSIPANGSSNG